MCNDIKYYNPLIYPPGYIKLTFKENNDMRFKRYLNEAKNSIDSDIKEFIEKNEFYKYYKTEEDFRGTCDGISSDLYKFLVDKGYKNVKAIEGVGVLFDLPKDHPHSNIPQFVSHVVIKVGNKVIDLTGKQFGFKKVRIIPISQFKKEFKKIKLFKPWSR